MNNASPPYDVDPAADVILRSSDNVHFYVLGSLLRFSSPFFRDMFALNRGPAAEENELKDNRPVIPFYEDSTTVRLLLDLLYPYSKETPLTDAALFWRVGKAAQKYLIDVIEDKLKDRVISSRLLSDAPLRLYAISIDLGWDCIAIEAARETLDTPLEDLDYVDELRSISGSAFYRFLEYRLRCDKSSDKLAEGLMVLPNIAPTEGITTTEASGEVVLPDVDAGTLGSSPHPFKPTPKSDLILRSSDSVDFYVSESVIRLVSHDFDSTFQLEGQETQDGKTIIHMTENSRTLRLLLNVIYYYVKKLDVCDYQLYKDVVVAVQKYKMHIIEDKLREQLLTSPLIQSDPLRVYALAVDLCWEDVIKAAALNTLLKPLQEINCTEYLDRITGGDLFRLMNFRFRCSDAALNALKTSTKFQYYGPIPWSIFWSQNNDGFYDHARRWITSTPYVSISSAEFDTKVKECPRGCTITKIYEAELEKLATNNIAYKGIARSICCLFHCWRDLGDLVEEAVSKVSFDLDESSL